MKLNISYPVTGQQKIIEIDDENKLRAFYDKRMSQEVNGEVLGEEFSGYILKITGGNDKQGFPMKQGILTASRVKVLMKDGHSCFRERRDGERKRKSVRGCIVSSELSVLALKIVKKGQQDIAGLTDEVKPRRLGPKRATRIRKLFNLDKEDDVRKAVVKREIKKDGKKTTYKSPKIQRLVTPRRLHRKRQRLALKKARYEKTRSESAAFHELLTKRAKEQRDQRANKLAKKRSLSRKDSAAPASN